jgi:hypothetical protein
VLYPSSLSWYAPWDPPTLFELVTASLAGGQVDVDCRSLLDGNRWIGDQHQVEHVLSLLY